MPADSRSHVPADLKVRCLLGMLAMNNLPNPLSFNKPSCLTTYMLHPSADSLVSADELEYNRVHGCYTVLQRYLSGPYFCSVIELDDNEAAISLCLVQFSSMPEDELLLAVGTVKGLTFYPRHVDGKEAPQWQLWADLSSLRYSVSRYIQQYVTLCGASNMWPGKDLLLC